MILSHHPLPETILSYVAGTLSSADACIVAYHISSCQKCSEDAYRLEIIGGVMLDGVEPVAVQDSDTDYALKRISAGSKKAVFSLAETLPEEMRKNRNGLSWKTDKEGAQYYWIDLPRTGDRIRVVRLMPGQALFDHFPAEDFTLALIQEGACGDKMGQYLPGDIVEWADDEHYDLVAIGDAPCIVMIAQNRPALAEVHYLSPSAKTPANKSFLWQRFEEGRAWAPALAASLAIIFGLGLGWVLHTGLSEGSSSLGDYLKIENNRLVAQGLLQSVLERSASGNAITSNNDMSLMLKMSFRNKAGEFCREYRIFSPDVEESAGVACRQDDRWILRFQALIPATNARTNEIKPASGDPFMYPLIESIIHGPPLDADEEAALISKGWIE